MQPLPTFQTEPPFLIQATRRSVPSAMVGADAPVMGCLSCTSDPESPQICRDLIQMYQNVPLTKI